MVRMSVPDMLRRRGGSWGVVDAIRVRALYRYASIPSGDNYYGFREIDCGGWFS